MDNGMEHGARSRPPQAARALRDLDFGHALTIGGHEVTIDAALVIAAARLLGVAADGRVTLDDFYDLFEYVDGLDEGVAASTGPPPDAQFSLPSSEFLFSSNVSCFKCDLAAFSCLI